MVRSGSFYACWNADVVEGDVFFLSAFGQPVLVLSSLEAARDRKFFLLAHITRD